MKKIIILFSILVLLCGCSKFDQSVIDARKNLINNIGVTTEDKIVVKNDDDYYVYNISNDYSYTAYLYKFHKSKKSYDKYIQKKENIEFYQLKTFDNSLVTREKYSSGSSTGDESIREKLINNIKKDDKNEIIEKKVQ